MLLQLVPLLLAGLNLVAQEPPRPRPKPRLPNPDREKPVPVIQLPEGFVQYARVPEGGSLPRLSVREGEIALLFFRGTIAQDGSGAGDLFLARSTDDARTFAPARRLTAEGGSVPVHKGLHSGSVELGSDGRAHVVWTTQGESPHLTYVCDRPGDDAQALDLGAPPGLGASTGLALDETGQVYLFYAAHDEGPPVGSAPPCRLWMRRSTDGTTFTDPVAVDEPDTGVSENSAISAHVDKHVGTVFVLYRTATPKNDQMLRDVSILSSEDHGATFKVARIERRKQKVDSIGSVELVQEVSSTLACWDGGGHVCWSKIRRKTNKADVPVEPRIDDNTWRMRPSTAAAGKELILAWLEQPADDRKAPPKLGWQVWYREGILPIGRGYAPDAPGSSYPAVFARTSGGYTIVY